MSSLFQATWWLRKKKKKKPRDWWIRRTWVDHEFLQEALHLGFPLWGWCENGHSTCGDLEAKLMGLVQYMGSDFSWWPLSPPMRSLSLAPEQWRGWSEDGRRAAVWPTTETTRTGRWPAARLRVCPAAFPVPGAFPLNVHLKLESQHPLETETTAGRDRKTQIVRQN